MKIRLGILVTHPIQYLSPWFRELAKCRDLDTKVYYCFRPDPEQQGHGFGKAFDWDIPLLDGYDLEFLTNIASRPGTHFYGCNTPEIQRRVSERDVWLIHGWQVRSYWQAMQACWRQRVPMMVRGDSILDKNRPLPLRVAKRLILGRWIPRFAGCLAVGKRNADYYRYYGAPEDRLFSVPHFVDNDWFSDRVAAERLHRDALRREWEIPQRAIVFLFCGKFAKGKRPMDCLKALKEKRRGNPAPGRESTAPSHLLMVGDGPSRSECQQYAQAEKLSVTFTGFLNQGKMPRAYSASDVLVLPSERETWGLVVNEAMASGLPALVSDGVGCAPDLIDTEETGATFRVGDILALSEQMDLYSRHPERAAAQGKNARKKVEDRNPQAAARALLKATTSVCQLCKNE